MKKKHQRIEFDVKKIGQPGIHIAYATKESVDFVKVYPSCIVTTDREGYPYQHNLDGSCRHKFGNSAANLHMFKTTEVMTIQEWYHGYGRGDNTMQLLRDFTESIKRGEVEL
jgi:hypothetical protein